MSEMLTEWRPIETMPRDGRLVLACHDGRREVATIEASDCTAQFWTHWAPLPRFWS